MGYEVRIATSPPGSAGGGLPLDAWLSIIDRWPELEARSEVVGVNPRTGDKIRIRLHHGAFLDTAGGLFLTYRNGEIHGPYVEEALPLLRRLARELTARLWGEDGEDLS